MKKTILILLSSAVLLSFVACQTKPEQSVSQNPIPTQTPIVTIKPTIKPTVKPTVAPTPSPTPQPTPFVFDETTNLLTGEQTLGDNAIGKRPIAVMINNATQSFPQYGVSDSDIVFEVTVEGNLTRLMCMYGDYTKVPDLCSVRSCRYYYPMISEGFDAIYVHWGIENDHVPDVFNNLNVDHLDGMYNSFGLYGRDQDKLNAGYALEHTSAFYGTKLVDAIGNNMRTDLDINKENNFFDFSHEELSFGEDISSFTADFGAYYSDFNYNQEDKLYYKNHNGNNHMDGRSNTQLAFKNVLILETPVNLMPNGHSGIKQIDVTGENKKGYYFSNGKYQEIKWTKNSGEDNFVFYNMNDEVIKLNTGKTYISIGATCSQVK